MSEEFDKLYYMASAEISRLKQDLEEAIEVIRPFAGIDNPEADEDFPDHTKVTVTFGRTTAYGLTLGDLRWARYFLDKAEK